MYSVYSCDRVSDVIYCNISMNVFMRIRKENRRDILVQCSKLKFVENLEIFSLFFSMSAFETFCLPSATWQYVYPSCNTCCTSAISGKVMLEDLGTTWSNLRGSTEQNGNSGSFKVIYFDVTEKPCTISDHLLQYNNCGLVCKSTADIVGERSVYHYFQRPHSHLTPLSSEPPRISAQNLSC